MTGRWRVRCVGIDGVVLLERTFRRRRPALSHAHDMASVFYDVLVEDTTGRHRPLIWPHTPPEALAQQLREPGGTE